jgi:pSer/pThr/pTyr-binding forkhead associated (FHA) protein
VAPLTCPHCRAEVPPGAALCWRCSGEVATRQPTRAEAAPAAPAQDHPAELVFPTGIVPVPAPGAHLLIGRDQAAVKEHLAEYTNVSRRHAEIYRSAAGVFVVDADSLNGTYVNEEKLIPARPHQLADGDEIRFGRNASAIVRIKP